jgi:hypothetical protein
MIQTMNPGMKGQPQAGLAALAQPAQAPKGMPSGSIQQILDRARMMSDAQLADILSGKSMDVPQYVAMTEAMGRKSLRNAVQGAQAQQQAKQPSIKDKLMGEYQQEQMAQMAPPTQGGIDQLPAPNMDTVDMAGGGIIAFQNTGLVEDENLDGMAYLSGQDPASLMKDKYRIEDLLEKKKLAEANKKLQEDKERYAFLKDAAPDTAAKMLKDNPSLIAPVAAAMPPITGKGSTAAVPAAPAAPKATGVGAAPGAQPYSIPSFESLQGKRSEEYLSKLEGIGEKRRAGLAELKKQGGGEALMQMGAGLLSAPTLGQGLAKGLPLVSSTSAATRKEARALESSADDYDLNVAKAREAAEKGDTALALQYTQLANQAKAQNDLAKYQQGMLNVYGQRAGALTGKGTTISREAALKAYNDMLKSDIRTKKQFPNFESYYQSVSNSTMGGGNGVKFLGFE